MLRSASAAVVLLGAASAGLRLQYCKGRQQKPRQRFHSRYQEAVVLRDGTWALLRPIRRFDSVRLAAEMERLSEMSRYRRFHRAKNDLSQEELRYLTQVDGTDHFALGAADARGKGIGVARFIRLPDLPTSADTAFVVADRMQGKGLGRILLERLREAACERGIETLRCEILPGNRGALRLLERLSPNAPRRYEEGVFIVLVPTTPDTL